MTHPELYTRSILLQVQVDHKVMESMVEFVQVRTLKEATSHRITPEIALTVVTHRDE